MSEVAVDSSVIIALALDESEAATFAKVLDSYQRRVMSVQGTHMPVMH